MDDRPRRPARSVLKVVVPLALLRQQVATRQARGSELTEQTLLVLRQSPAARACTTCGQPVRIRYRGRCPACHQYWYRHGVERPARLWQR